VASIHWHRYILYMRVFLCIYYIHNTVSFFYRIWHLIDLVWHLPHCHIIWVEHVFRKRIVDTMETLLVGPRWIFEYFDFDVGVIDFSLSCHANPPNLGPWTPDTVWPSRTLSILSGPIYSVNIWNSIKEIVVSNILSKKKGKSNLIKYTSTNT